MTAQKIGLVILLLMIAAAFGLLIYGAIQSSSQPAPSAAATADQAKMVQTLTLPAPTAVATAKPVKVQVTQQVTQAAAQSSQTPQASTIPVWVVWAGIIVVGLLVLWLLWIIVKAFVRAIWKKESSIFKNILRMLLWVIFIAALIPALFLPDNERNSVFGLLFFGYWTWRFVKWLFKKIFGKTRLVGCSGCGGRGTILFLSPHNSDYVLCSLCNGTGQIEVADMTPVGWILLLLGIAGIIWGFAGAGFFLGLIAFFVFMAGLITLFNNSSYASFWTL